MESSSTEHRDFNTQQILASVLRTHQRGLDPAATVVTLLRTPTPIVPRSLQPPHGTLRFKQRLQSSAVFAVLFDLVLQFPRVKVSTLSVAPRRSQLAVIRQPFS